MFSGTPFTARTKLEGHAVRAMYACCGATDYYMETGDPAYWKTLNTLWEDMTAPKCTSPAESGRASEGEAFGEAYELPNDRAYGESCAAIGNMMWNWRMLAASGETRSSPMSSSARCITESIPECRSMEHFTAIAIRWPLILPRGEKIRNPWYDTTCCPPNLERTFASLPGYFYSTSKDGIYLHLYDNSELNWHLENGVGLKVTQKTNYPWDGGVDITVSPAQPSNFTFYLRIPGMGRQCASRSEWQGG